MVYRLSILFFLFLTPSLSVGEEVYFDADCLTCVVDFIKDTKTELKAAVFDINEPSIIDAIQDLHWRGKTVRILSDRRQAGGKYSRVIDLYLLGIDVRLNSKRNLQHNKFAVRDGKASVSGSFNWTRGASNRNSEDVTSLRKGWFTSSVNAMINDYETKFESDWEKNTQEKSDGYFTKLIAKNRTDLLDRWKTWIHDTLSYESPRTRKGSARIGAALSIIEKLRYYPPKVLGFLRGGASGRLGSVHRAHAVRLLGESNTNNLAVHRTLVTQARFGPKEVSEAAEHAIEHLGKKLRVDPKTYWDGLWGKLRATRARCSQVLGFLRPW